MTPVEIIRAEGHTEVTLSNNKRSYHLVRYLHRHHKIFSHYQGVIFKQTHNGWERTGHEGDYKVMVTCLDTLTRN